MKPVSKTAYFCCGVRMTDAQQKRPLCGDQFAKRFMDAEALAFYAPLEAHRGAVQGNAARHRIIDDYLRQKLARDPKLPIFIVGAGFDSRPYRLRGGTWLEFDEPAIITLKNERLPLSECPNALTRIAIDFAEEQLVDKLAPYRTEGPCVFVFEGVFMYVEERSIAEILRTLRASFPRHSLVCDLMRRAFVEKYSVATRAYLERFGAYFRVVDDPYAVFTEAGRSLTQSISIIERIFELSMPQPLAFLSRLLPRELRDGYKVNVFELASEAPKQTNPPRLPSEPSSIPCCD